MPEPEAAPEAADRSAEEAETRRQQSDSALVVKRYMDRVSNPMTAIRARCVQCCNGQPSEVRLCPAKSCALHPFRMGDNPYNLKTRRGLAKELGMTLEEYDKHTGFTHRGTAAESAGDDE